MADEPIIPILLPEDGVKPIVAVRADAIQAADGNLIPPPGIRKVSPVPAAITARPSPVMDFAGRWIVAALGVCFIAVIAVVVANERGRGDDDFTKMQQAVSQFHSAFVAASEDHGRTKVVGLLIKAKETAASVDFRGLHKIDRGYALEFEKLKKAMDDVLEGYLDVESDKVKSGHAGYVAFNEYSKKRDGK